MGSTAAFDIIRSIGEKARNIRPSHSFVHPHSSVRNVPSTFIRPHSFRSSSFVHPHSSVTEVFSSVRAHPHCTASCNASLAMAMLSHTSLVVAPSRPLLLNSFWSGFKPSHFSVTPPPLRRGRRIGYDSDPRIGRQGVVAGFLPVDPWAPNTDQQSIASSLFAASLFPYLGFLYHLTKSKTAPKLTLFGFYFLLAFVGATIPAGIYAKVHYGTSLSNVDWLHGGAESFLTLTNLFIVFGLRNALQNPPKSEDDAPAQEEDERIPLSK